MGGWADAVTRFVDIWASPLLFVVAGVLAVASSVVRENHADTARTGAVGLRRIETVLAVALVIVVALAAALAVRMMLMRAL